MDVVEEDKGSALVDNVVDHTVDFEDENEKKIPLEVGIDMRRLLNHEPVLLVPEVNTDDLADSVPKHNATFFSDAVSQADERQLEEMFDCLGMDNEEEEQEEDDDTGSFERKSRSMEDVLPDGGVKKKVVRPGLMSEGVVPSKATVTIHYSLYLEDSDEPYDSSTLRGRCERYKLDDGQLFTGLEAGIETMRKKEKARFLIQPNYAFGALGCPPRVPGNAQILADVELLDFVLEGQADALLAMPPADRNKLHGYDDIAKIVSREHVEGNAFAKRGEWKLAARRYERGSRLLKDVGLKSSNEEERQRQLSMKMYNNRGLCYLKIGWPKKACLVLQDALEVDPKNAKSLYRMGKAKAMLFNYVEARKYLARAYSVSPGDESIGKELARVDRWLKEEKTNEMELCKRMVGVDSDSWKNVCRDIDDEDYEEIASQLKEFKKSRHNQEFVLSSGMRPSDLRVTEKVVESVGGLALRQVEGKKQWKIVKV